LEAPDINHCFRGSEQLPQIHDAKKAGAPKCGVIHVIDAGQCAGMRGGGLGRSFVPARLEDDDRLYPSGGACGGHEFARVGDCLDIEQDHPCVPVKREVIEQVAEVNIEGIAKRDDAAEAGPLSGSPFDHSCCHRTRL
jgi:hypothetical protein